MRFQYCVVEVSDVAWQEIMDSDEDDEANQHLNRWGDRGWEVVCVVPKMESGTTTGYGIVFKKELSDEDRKLHGEL